MKKRRRTISEDEEAFVMVSIHLVLFAIIVFIFGIAMGQFYAKNFL